MTRLSLSFVVTITCSLCAGAPAMAQDTASPSPETGARTGAAVKAGDQADRAQLYRLVRQVRRIDRDSEQLMEQAMAEARSNGGSADPVTKVRMLSLRDQRDRLFSRLLILSMRHGWEIPDFDKPTVNRSSRQESEQSVFGAIDVLVNRRFAADAMRLAATLPLPVVSLESMAR